MPETHRIEFPGSRFAPVELAEGAQLATELTARNSPVLFGCRSGICGTCLVEVDDPGGRQPPPAEEELEALEIFAPGNPRARLACQMRLRSSLQLRKIESA